MAVSLPSARQRGRAYAIPGVVDVWRVDLSRTAEEVLWELLCAEERARAARIVDARRRALWARSRGVLRALLARYLDDADPRELRFELGARGKPGLRSKPTDTRRTGSSEDLRFNLSHAGELMLLAVTIGREVGVDIEVTRNPARRPIDELAIAARVLGSSQAQRLRSLNVEERTGEFLRAWTMREAAVKCLGTGLTRESAAGEEGVDAGLWTAELDVGPGAFAAVAVEGGGAYELRHRDAPPKFEV